MIEINKCQDCGANLEHRIKGSIQGLFCERCDKWVLVTTYISEIRQDETRYKIYLLCADSKNKQHIRALAKVGLAEKIEEGDAAYILRPKEYIQMQEKSLK